VSKVFSAKILQDVPDCALDMLLSSIPVINKTMKMHFQIILHAFWTFKNIKFMEHSTSIFA
jgi:hypothetical protein